MFKQVDRVDVVVVVVIAALFPHLIIILSLFESCEADWSARPLRYSVPKNSEPDEHVKAI